MNIHSAHFLPGTNKRLGTKYLLLECLGDGSHGWVWRAERLKDSEIVAVKIPKDLSKDDRHLIEGADLIKITPHKNIIQIFDMGRIPPENYWFFIEMEYFPSQSLAQKLEYREKNGGDTFERLFNIYKQVLDAINYLANLARPISHGDIKPHNILVGANDLIKLTDFGSSALPEEIYVRTRENGGTVLYAAPEFSDCISRKGSFSQLLSGDIYSLGVLLYQLVTGQLPHDTQAQVRYHNPFKKPSEINSSIHPELESVILKCLEKLPEDRFKSIEQLISHFENARKKQQSFSNYSLPIPPPVTHDWSSYVMKAMDEGDYRKAAKLAELEYQRTSELSALLHQLNALNRANRLFEFEQVFCNEKSRLIEVNADTATIRLLAIKVYTLLRRTDEAKSILKEAVSLDGESFELELLSASISGLEADYHLAKQKLESLNRNHPGNMQILLRLIQACEQLRDYKSAAGYLRAALKNSAHDENLREKKLYYERLGVW